MGRRSRPGLPKHALRAGDGQWPHRSALSAATASEPGARWCAAWTCRQKRSSAPSAARSVFTPPGRSARRSAICPVGHRTACLTAAITDEGETAVFAAVDHCSAGLADHHDHGLQCMSDAFQKELHFPLASGARPPSSVRRRAAAARSASSAPSRKTCPGSGPRHRRAATPGAARVPRDLQRDLAHRAAWSQAAQRRPAGSAFNRRSRRIGCSSASQHPRAAHFRARSAMGTRAKAKPQEPVSRPCRTMRNAPGSNPGSRPSRLDSTHAHAAVHTARLGLDSRP